MFVKDFVRHIVGDKCIFLFSPKVLSTTKIDVSSNTDNYLHRIGWNIISPFFSWNYTNFRDIDRSNNPLKCIHTHKYYEK